MTPPGTGVVTPDSATALPLLSMRLRRETRPHLGQVAGGEGAVRPAAEMHSVCMVRVQHGRPLPQVVFRGGCGAALWSSRSAGEHAGNARMCGMCEVIDTRCPGYRSRGASGGCGNL